MKHGYVSVATPTKHHEFHPWGSFSRDPSTVDDKHDRQDQSGMTNQLLNVSRTVPKGISLQLELILSCGESLGPYY